MYSESCYASKMERFTKIVNMLQSWKKLIRQSKEIKHNGTRPRNFNVCFCVFLAAMVKVLIREELGIEIFLIFPCLL